MAEQDTVDTVDLSPRDRITQEGQLLGSVPGTGKHTSDVGEVSLSIKLVPNDNGNQL